MTTTEADIVDIPDDANGSNGVAPRRTRRRQVTFPIRLRAILLMLVVVGVQSIIYYFLVRHQAGGFADLFGRASNFASLKSTGNIYSNFSIEAFTYPPGGILLLSPLVLIPTSLLAPMWTYGVLLALTMTMYVALRFLTRHNVTNAILMATAATVISPIVLSSVYDNIFWGQIGTQLTLAIVVDFLYVRGSLQGVAVGLATAVKVYPGIFIVIWLVRRQYRPAITALATVAATTALATLFFYHSAVAFFHNQIAGSQELQHFATYSTAQASSSIDDIFLRPPYFFGHLSPSAALSVDAVFVVIGVIASYGAWRRGHEFTAVIIGLIISTICSPIAWNHYFAFVPLMLLLPLEIGWRRWTTGAAYVAVAVNIVPWPRWKLVGVVQVLLDHFHLYLSYVAQNATMVSMLAVMLIAAAEFWPRSRTRAGHGARRRRRRRDAGRRSARGSAATRQRELSA